MTAGAMFTYAGLILLALVAGAVAGGLTAAWRMNHSELVSEPAGTTESERDEFVDAEIDLAAIEWAETHDQPPAAAGLMAARLKTLHHIGKNKGWF